MEPNSQFRWKKFPQAPVSFGGLSTASTIALEQTTPGDEDTPASPDANRQTGYEEGYAAGLEAAQAERAQERASVAEELGAAVTGLRQHEVQLHKLYAGQAVEIVRQLFLGVLNSELAQSSAVFETIEARLKEALGKHDGPTTLVMSKQGNEAIREAFSSRDDVHVEFSESLSPGTFQLRSDSHMAEIDLLENLQAILDEAVLKNTEAGIDDQ